MSTTAFLNTLKKYDLQQGSSHSIGMIHFLFMSQLNMQDYSKLGVRSIDDKRKFMEIANEVKQQQRMIQEQQQQGSPGESRKRPIAPVHKAASPERKNRRLTIGPTSALSKRRNGSGPSSSAAPASIPRVIPTSKRTDTATVSRRSSYAPSRTTATATATTTATTTATLTKSSPNRLTKASPVRPTTKSSPSRTNPVIPAAASLVTKPPQIPVTRPPERHLDAYGIPTKTKQRRLSGNAQPWSSSVLDDPPATAASHTNTTTAAAVAKLSLSSEFNQRIRVCVRKRPLSRKERTNGELDISQLVGAHTIQLNAPKTKVDMTPYTEQHMFTFDEAFDSDTSNVDIYNRTARPLVHYVFGGGKATCFAFGQTGSGKTYTMLDPKHGLYVMAAKDIFALLETPEYDHLSASVGFYEIYQGRLFDLLNERKQLFPRDDGNNNVVIAELREYAIRELKHLLQIFDHGSRSRSTGQTGANDNSSRSHAVLQVLLRDKESKSIHGKLSFIDLAGSERGVDRGEANPKARAEINKSLLALKECIRALDQDKKHTPFRGSKLTQVLRDSFVGDSRTCMIATISPNHSNSEHTLNTLRYADRVKELKGESDPRLQPTSLATADLQSDDLDHTAINTDALSVTTNDIWGDDDETENLMEVDFPADAISSNNILGTPHNQRTWPSSNQRQEAFIRRLSSPPRDLFLQRHHSETAASLEDDLFANSTSPQRHALSPIHHTSAALAGKSHLTGLSSSASPAVASSSGFDLSSASASASTPAYAPPHRKSSRGHSSDDFYDAMDHTPRQVDHLPTTTALEITSSAMSSAMLPHDATHTSQTSLPAGPSVPQIREFMRLHRAQIKQFEDFIKQEKKMIAKLTLTISSHHDFNDEEDTNLDPHQSNLNHAKVVDEYEQYLTDLKDVLDQKSATIDYLRDQVKVEQNDEFIDMDE
ncbi:kinesin-domain-containing protein [Hesseltinella vesiculosa]|uniref:Kinesin-like protein n=1 Tax=Hesseltinella vesiculosa TaxID=101127 RepID=A0A1X2GI25_9FUNG|nr:kinesin-domain-containing protein [Hesseltinella vesiculosa]